MQMAKSARIPGNIKLLFKGLRDWKIDSGSFCSSHRAITFLKPLAFLPGKVRLSR